MESLEFQKLKAPCLHCEYLTLHCLLSLFACSEGEDYSPPQKSVVYICLAAVGAINHIEVHDS